MQLETAQSQTHVQPTGNMQAWCNQIPRYNAVSDNSTGLAGISLWRHAVASASASADLNRSKTQDGLGTCLLQPSGLWPSSFPATLAQQQ